MKIKQKKMAVVLLGAGLFSLAAAPVFAQQKNPERNVHYGETHLHTSWSFDAYAFGDTQTGPEGFYQYATESRPCTLEATR